METQSPNIPNRLSESQAELLQDILDLHRSGQVLINLHIPQQERDAVDALVLWGYVRCHPSATPGIWTVAPTLKAIMALEDAA